MKIIALGGAGDVGSRAVELLSAQPDVSGITIADRAVDRAHRLAAELGGPRCPIVVEAVDAGDHRRLVEVIAGHDLAVSAIGPYFRFESRLVAATLEAGVDYVSACDEWDATEAVFAQFEDRATQAGHLVMLGLGASPGITNLGVKLLCGELDRVRRADVYVYQPWIAGGQEAVVRHLLHIISGDVALWRGGRRVFAPSCSERRTVTFPRHGDLSVWTMGHPEPTTLPRYLPGIDEVSFFMGLGRGTRLCVGPARLGLFRSSRAVEATVRLLSAIERSAKLAPSEGAIRLDVWGSIAGLPVHRMLCGTGHMRDVTGVSLAVGALMAARQQQTHRRGGVFAPESYLDAGDFIASLKRHGIETYRDLAMVQKA
jgi:hypothetical protein